MYNNLLIYFSIIAIYNTALFSNNTRSNNTRGDLIPGSRPFFSKWRSTLHDRKITLVCDKALK